MNKYAVLLGLWLGLTTQGQEAAKPFRYEFGHFIINTLNESEGSGSEAILIGLPPEVKQTYMPDGSYPNAVNAFLIRIREHNVLVDAGFGTKLIENLAVQGVTSSDIDIILMTHLHGDHIGGLVKQDTAAFSNANLYIARPEYEYWTDDAVYSSIPENNRGNFDKVRQLVRLYKERIVLFTPADMGRQTTPLIPGIYAMAAYGHTPGHTVFLLEDSDGQKFMIWGDLTHALSVQIPHPEIAVTYDLDPELAIKSREQTLRYVTKENIPVAGMHIPFPGMGKVTKNGIRYTFTPSD